jgi:hypothetical protein
VKESRRILAVFLRDEDVLAAAEGARAAGLRVVDVYGPYHVHGLARVLELPPSRLPTVCLAAGVLGAVLKLAFELWTAVVDWPLNVGGKPFNSLPAFVPITFEVMVLFAGVATMGAFALAAGLRPGAAPRFRYPGVTDDRFVLRAEPSGAMSVAAAVRLLERFGAVEVQEEREPGR